MSFGLKQKDVGVFKTSSHSGNVGVIDVGDSVGKEYIIDLDELDALTFLGLNRARDTRDQIREVLDDGQDGKRYQNSELGLTDNITGDLDTELIELIRHAASGEDAAGNPSDVFGLVGVGNGSVSVSVDGRGSVDDILTFEGDALNQALAQLSDIEAICDALPTQLDLKNSASQIAVFDFDEKKNHFHGSDADVDSAAVKGILGGSSINVEEAVELIQYALSADGQEDEHISIDFNGAGIIVNIDASRDTTDTIIFKGEGLFDAVNTTLFNGKPIVDLKNKTDQFAIFDFDEHNSYFHGSAADVDSEAAKAFLGGSSMNSSDAEGLVALAMSGNDANVRYLGGDDNSAIVAIDASRDSVDTLFITSDTFDFIM